MEPITLAATALQNCITNAAKEKGEREANKDADRAINIGLAALLCHILMTPLRKARRHRRPRRDGSDADGNLAIMAAAIATRRIMPAIKALTEADLMEVRRVKEAATAVLMEVVEAISSADPRN